MIDMYKPGALQQTLSAMSHQDLLDLVLKLSSDSPDFSRALLANIRYAPKPGKTEQVRQLKQQISNFFAAFPTRYAYLDPEYDEDESYPELDPMIEAAKMLPSNERIEVLWHLVLCGKQMFEHENLPVGTQQIEAAINFYAEAVRQSALSHQEKQPYFDALVNALTWRMSGYGEVSDALEKAISTLCAGTQDYQYLLTRLETSDYSRANELSAGYYLKLGDQENYLRIRQANLKTEAHYLELANYWLQKQNKQKYIATLELGASFLLQQRREPRYSFDFLFLGSSVKPSELLRTLADYYTLKHDYENLCRILIATAEYSGVNLDLYEQVKTAASANQWQELQPQLLEFAKRNPEILAQIYLFESDWEAAIQLAHRHLHAERLQVLVAEGVKEHYPQASLKIYEQLVQHYIGLQSREHYRTAARHAGAIKSIYQDILKAPETGRNYINAICQRYPRYRALQNEFRRL